MGNIVNFSKHKSLAKLLSPTKPKLHFHVAEDHPEYDAKEPKSPKSPKFSITDDKSLYAYYQLTKANTPDNVLDRATRLKGASIVSQIKTIRVQQLHGSITVAAKTPRGRSAILLNDEFSEKPQRFVNCLSPATYVRPHKHTLPNQWELMCHLTGEFAVLFFNESGVVVERLEMSNEAHKIVEIPPNVYHSFIALTPCSYLEVRNCAYEPEIDRVYADWAPPENSAENLKYLKRLYSARIGELVTITEHHY